MSSLSGLLGFEPDDAQRRVLDFLQLEGSSTSGAAFPAAGDRVADFVIERELGRGGAGVVYRARQVPLGRTVALKLVPHGPALLTDAYAQRLAREGRMLAAVRHASIPTVHAAGAVPGFHYVAVELVDGTNLADVIAGRAPGLPRPGEPDWLPFLLPLLHRVAGALAATHARGIVHRDVKPSNVLVDRGGQPYLVDFGLARESEVTGLTLTRGFVGTARYASPEQVRGEPFGVASDVFSFGVLAFEALNGVHPFAGKTERASVERILAGDPRWPVTRRVPHDLRDVIEKCLEKRVEHRYADAGDVEAELGRLLRFEPVRAAPRGRLARTWRRIRIQPGRALAVACVIALVGFAACAAVLWSERRTERERLALGAEYGEIVGRFGKGKVDEYIAGLEALLPRDDRPVGVAGRLADMRLFRERPGDAVALYAVDLASEGAWFADWIGSHTAQALVDGEAPEVTFEEGPEPIKSRDYMMLAFYHEMRGEFELALRAIEEAQAKQPVCMEFRLQAVRYLERLGRHSDAAEELLIASRSRRGDPRFPLLLAQTWQRLGRHEEAEELFTEALVAFPDDPRFSAELALCKHRRGECESALALAQRAYLRAPGNGRVAEVLAVNLACTGRVAEARSHLRGATLALPGDPHVIRSSARLALECGELEEAERLARQLETVVARDAAWRTARLELDGDLQAARGELEEAIETLLCLETLEPGVVDWPKKLRALLAGAARAKEAEPTFRGARAEAPDAESRGARASD